MKARPAAKPATTPSPATPPPPAAPVPPPAPASGPAPVPSQAQALLQPIASTPAPEPAEVTPQAAQSRPRAARSQAPTRRLAAGDFICGQCGEGNPPTRRFCSRCGESLRAAAVVRRRWWQWRRRKGPRTADAGTRPGQRGGGGRFGGVLGTVFRRVNTVAAALLFAVGVAYLIYPPLRTYVNNAVSTPVRNVRAWADRKINPQYVAVRPLEVTSPSSVAKHGPELALDQYSNTDWEAHWAPDRPPTLILRFSGKVNLDRLIVTSGSAEHYTDTARPAELHLVYSTDRSDTLAIQDTGRQQTLTLTGARDVTTVEVQITRVYPSVKGKDVALSELEFFGLQ